MNRIEYFVKESKPTFMVFECLKGRDVCPCVREICANIRRDYGYEISYLKAWQEKQLALVKLFSEWDQSFDKLPHLMQALVDSSPEIFVKWDRTPLDNVVENEINSSWTWFMSCIQEGITQREGLCIISDRHKEILAAMREPQWSPPYAYHRAEYADLLDLLHDKPEARKWLVDIILELWSQAFNAGGIRWGSMMTNASECFNDILKGGHDLPILSLVMFTFRQTAASFVKRQQTPYDGHGALFPPKIRKKLATLRARADYHRVIAYDKERAVYERTCSCGKWGLLHFSYSHAMAVCKWERVDYSDYVAHEYTLQAYHAN
ncbi:hypothetical protein QQ045_018400 [Rhodiola kirilowii]